MSYFEHWQSKYVLEPFMCIWTGLNTNMFEKNKNSLNISMINIVCLMMRKLQNMDLNSRNEIKPLFEKQKHIFR